MPCHGNISWEPASIPCWLGLPRPHGLPSRSGGTPRLSSHASPLQGPGGRFLGGEKYRFEEASLPRSWEQTDGRWPPSRAFLRPPLPVIVGRCGGLRSLPRFLGGDADVWSRQASAFCWSSRPPPSPFLTVATVTTSCLQGLHFLINGGLIHICFLLGTHAGPPRGSQEPSALWCLYVWAQATPQDPVLLKASPHLQQLYLLVTSVFFLFFNILFTKN